AIPIIPLLIGNASMPSPMDLPNTLEPLAFLNASQIDPGRDFGIHMRRLASNLEAHFGLPPITQLVETQEAHMSVDLARWDAIKGSDDPKDIKAFIDRYRNGNMVDLAQKRLQSMEEEQWKFASRQDTIDGLSAFLQQFPDGQFAVQAKGRIAYLQEEK